LLGAPAAEPAPLAQGDVLRHGEGGHQPEVLVHHAHPGLDGVARRVQLDGLAPEPDRAGVGPVQPGEDVREGGLAGTVLAEQRVDLARPDLEVDGVVGEDAAGEPLGDAGRDDGRGGAQPFGSPSTPWTNQSTERMSPSDIFSPSGTRTVPAWSVSGPSNS
jgi:hypothetical protein